MRTCGSSPGDRHLLRCPRRGLREVPGGRGGLRYDRGPAVNKQNELVPIIASQGQDEMNADLWWQKPPVSASWPWPVWPMS